MSSDPNRELSRIAKTVPFWNLLGLEIDDVSDGRSKIRLKVRPELRQLYGVVHGGAIASLADTATGVALSTRVSRDSVLSTVEMKVNFLKPVTEGEIRAEAEIVFLGGRLAVGDVDLRDDHDQLIAKALVTYNIRKGDEAG